YPTPATGIPGNADTISLIQKLYQTTSQVDAISQAAGADELRVGVFMLNNYDLDMTVPMASSTGILWLRWQEPFQKKLEAAEATAADLLILPNQIQSWNGQIKVIDETPIRLADGEYYQRLRFDNNFYVQHLGLEHYPFQDVHIPLMVQLNDASGDFTFDKLRLVPDHVDSGVGRFIDLNGFVMRGWNISEFRTTYASDFGLSTQRHSKEHMSMSEVIFDVLYSRSPRSSIWTLFQPLAIVMATVILSPSLSSRFWDIRIAIPATAILTMVFLQQGYRAELPQLPFLTFIDRIYVICYGICLACFGLYVWAANALQAAAGEREDLVAQQIDRVDLRFQWISLISLLVGGLISWMMI
ncbi:MAG: hypothetical protein EBU88_18880, partial [Acidobacteria bacterium]|nr:hypothetical protein [Acidobacteriota bacterium]